MYDFSDVLLIPITTDSILLKISEYDIFKFYCSSFIEVNKVFKSELRKDRSPSCCIQSYQNKLFYKDFATGDSVDCFGYVQKRFNCTFHESLRIIANDFGLISVKKRAVEGLPVIHERVSYKQANTVIEPVYRSWRSQDYEYWNSYGISFELLDKYNVKPCKYVFVNSCRYDDRITSPIYCYDFGEGKYKIYRPLEDNYRWFSNTNKSIIQGINQLPENGDILLITKSLKDVICYNSLEISAIAPQSESTNINDDIMSQLKNRFTKIILNYDFDVTGVKFGEEFAKKHNLNWFYIQQAKDVADLIKLKGIDYTKKYINECINSKDFSGPQGNLG